MTHRHPWPWSTLAFYAAQTVTQPGEPEPHPSLCCPGPLCPGAASLEGTDQQDFQLLKPIFSFNLNSWSPLQPKGKPPGERLLAKDPLTR